MNIVHENESPNKKTRQYAISPQAKSPINLNLNCLNRQSDIAIISNNSDIKETINKEFKISSPNNRINSPPAIKNLNQFDTSFSYADKNHQVQRKQNHFRMRKISTNT